MQLKQTEVIIFKAFSWHVRNTGCYKCYDLDAGETLLKSIVPINSCLARKMQIIL
jgi:hypothetical protein